MSQRCDFDGCTRPTASGVDAYCEVHMFNKADWLLLYAQMKALRAFWHERLAKRGAVHV